MTVIWHSSNIYFVFLSRIYAWGNSLPCSAVVPISITSRTHLSSCRAQSAHIYISWSITYRLCHAHLHSRWYPPPLPPVPTVIPCRARLHYPTFVPTPTPHRPATSLPPKQPFFSLIQSATRDYCGARLTLRLTALLQLQRRCSRSRLQRIKTSS